MKKRFGSMAIAIGLCFALAIPAFADENSTGTLYANANTAANVSQNKSSSGNAPIYVETERAHRLIPILRLDLAVRKSSCLKEMKVVSRLVL